MIASSRESVNGALRGLRRRGLIGADGRRIAVLEPAELAKIARR